MKKIVAFVLISAVFAFSQITGSGSQAIKIRGVGAMSNGIYFWTDVAVEEFKQKISSVSGTHYMIYDTDPNYEVKVATILTAHAEKYLVELYADMAQGGSNTPWLHVDRLWSKIN